MKHQFRSNQVSTCSILPKTESFGSVVVISVTYMNESTSSSLIFDMYEICDDSAAVGM